MIEQTTPKKEQSHSAISSWSGYNYQGKVALYCALSFINNHDEKDLSPYTIELEWYEDFSIKKENNYLSIHQIKSYKKTYLSAYKKDIWNLLGKSTLNIKPQPVAYLHTSETILSKEAIKNDLYSSNPPGGDANTKYSSAYYCKKILDNNLYDHAFENFFIFEYPNNQSHCGIDEVFGLIKEEINQFCQLNEIDATSNRIEHTSLKLLNYMDSHITTRHKEEQITGSKTDPIPIHFNDLINLLKTDWENPSEDYYAYYLKNILYTTCEKYIHNLYKYGSGITEDQIIRVEKILKRAYLLNSKDFLELCKRISPQKTILKMDMKSYHSLLQNEEIEGSLITILLEIHQTLNERYLYEKEEVNGTHYYLPTTIHKDPEKTDHFGPNYVKGNTAREILKNDTLDEFLFEVDVIITRHINSKSLEEAATKINEVPEINAEPNEDRHKRITKIKEIRMVNKDQAAEELNQ